MNGVKPYYLHSIYATAAPYQAHIAARAEQE